MSATVLSLAVVSVREDTAQQRVDDSAKNKSDKAPSFWAACTRAIFGTLAFLFKRPIRLFRPVKLSTWTGIQAIAEEQGRSVTPSFVRALIRKEGWRFFPRHVAPPLMLNAVIGFTLFAAYTSSESYLRPRLSSLSYSSQAVIVPFVCGSIAGGAQSLISAPLDNARLLLLRRQRLIRQYGRRQAGRHGAFTGWGSLMRDAVLQSVGGASQIEQSRVARARQWARRGWSLWSLTLTKDSMSFGIFFTVFELGREGARRVGLAYDGIDATVLPPAPTEAVDDGEYSDEFDGGTRKRLRSWPSLVLQSFLILAAGGVAGASFAVIGRPFDRARAAIFEGRTKWAERESRITRLEELEAKRMSTASPSTGRHVDKRPSRARPPGSAKRRAVREQVARRRGVGRIFVRAKRRLIKRKLRMKHTTIAVVTQQPDRIVRQKLSTHSLPQRQPMPSAVSLVRQAAQKYGARQLFFSSRPALKQLDNRASIAKTLKPPAPRAGPTRLSARGRVVQAAMKRTGAWRVGTVILKYLPPYSVGFFAWALMSGDLR